MADVLSTKETLDLFDRYVVANYGRLPVVIVRGEGSRVWDADGKEYLDLFAGWAVTALGHCHPRLVAAIREQAGQLIYMANHMYTQPQGRLAQLLSEQSFGGKCFFCNSGAEAIEAAIKLARLHTPREKYKVLTFEDSFHGRTFGAISATAQSKYHQGFQPLLAGFEYLPLNDLDAVYGAVDDETCGILVEPIQGEGGVIIPPEGYLRRVRELCTKYNVLFIADEIQTGLGRTGKLFACDHEDVRPDMVTIGKALSGGFYPVSAALSSREVLGVFNPGDHGSTFGGNPLGVAVARAALRALVEEEMIANAGEMGEYFQDQLVEINSPHVKEVRGKGLMIGVELHPQAGGARRFCEALQERGILAKETHHNIIRFAPPLIITQEQIDWAIERIRPVLQLS